MRPHREHTFAAFPAAQLLGMVLLGMVLGMMLLGMLLLGMVLGGGGGRLRASAAVVRGGALPRARVGSIG